MIRPKKRINIRIKQMNTKVNVTNRKDMLLHIIGIIIRPRDQHRQTSDSKHVDLQKDVGVNHQFKGVRILHQENIMNQGVEHRHFMIEIINLQLHIVKSELQRRHPLDGILNLRNRIV